MSKKLEKDEFYYITDAVYLIAKVLSNETTNRHKESNMDEESIIALWSAIHGLSKEVLQAKGGLTL